jgi:glycerol-3-phosphate O-acyltransferase
MTKHTSLDEVTRAVLDHEEVQGLLRGSHGGTEAEVRERVLAYIGELRTTQRYAFYHALQHPLYPILRKIQRIDEHIDVPARATLAGRVLYASNHRSHIDYLVEPIVLDDNGIRPPLIVAGINLFGGPFGLIHRHLTGAIPIRRNTKDPIYLITLKAYVAEVLREHDLLFYPEGGRSYSGELKPHKTGLLHAAMEAGRTDLLLVPTAIAYDVVLEDSVLAPLGALARQRPFAHELAQMVRLAMGYKTRAFVTFGEPIALSGYDPESRRDILEVAHLTRAAIGRLCKVLPTAVVAAAMRPSITRPDLESRIAATLDQLQRAGANLDVTEARQTLDDGVSRLERRGVIQRERDHLRVRQRSVLRFYARAIEHLLPAPATRV